MKVLFAINGYKILIVKYIDEECAFGLYGSIEDKIIYSFMKPITGFSEIEVIGNIYENPELLNNKKLYG